MRPRGGRGAGMVRATAKTVVIKYTTRGGRPHDVCIVYTLQCTTQNSHVRHPVGRSRGRYYTYTSALYVRSYSDGQSGGIWGTRDDGVSRDVHGARWKKSKTGKMWWISRDGDSRGADLRRFHGTRINYDRLLRVVHVGWIFKKRPSRCTLRSVQSLRVLVSTRHTLLLSSFAYASEKVVCNGVMSPLELRTCWYRPIEWD